MDKYTQAYENKFKEMEEKLNDSSISELLCMKHMADAKLDEICARISQVINKPVWKDFYFRTGKIFGIMRSILQNPTQRAKLLEITNLEDAIINIYMDVAGNLPYVDGKNTVNKGRHMKIQETKDLLVVIAHRMGVCIDESDLIDINETYWLKLYNKKLEAAEESVKFSVKTDIAIEYDE